MTDYPKLSSVKLRSNHLFELQFDNGEVRQMHPHFIGGPTQLQHKFFGLFSRAQQIQKITITSDGTLIINGNDYYSAEELWNSSKPIRSQSHRNGVKTMKAKLGNSIVDFWKISKNDLSEEWVENAFSKKQIWWATINSDVLVVVQGVGVAHGKVNDYLIKQADNNFLVLDQKEISRLTFIPSEATGQPSKEKSSLIDFQRLDFPSPIELTLAQSKIDEIPKKQDAKIFKVVFGFDILEAWKITYDETPISWLEKAFRNRHVYWRILGTAEQNTIYLAASNLIGIVLGSPDDYLIKTNNGFRIVPKKDFGKYYKKL